ncbi:unnamed protein product [Ceutorhynchus assimilis]|uniref:Uncharacterized protein n=1 Tax=Ceutorhynchus assimilis TaxID=467358 RepID=A0A9N9N037_9CUCU|nr:unnamed protein product [Ceutorhynchus assimilis]
MSRRASNHHQPRYTENNPYHVTTIARPQLYHHQQKIHHQRKSFTHQPQTTVDIGVSDATTTDTYYDYCAAEDRSTFLPLRESRNTDVTFSDDSGSTRLPYFEFDEESNKGRNSFSDRSFQRLQRHGIRQDELEEEPFEDRLYHEIQTPCDNGPIPVQTTNGRRPVISRTSDRPQSSMSSALTNAMVYGCGGKCQTFESVCYFLLQLIFTMGILIGVSLCIAGLVLRRSAARNLQVLVYIGIMLAMVSSLLLTIQCRAKNVAKRRIKAIQSAKRAPIQMETLNIRSNPVHLDRLPSIRENQRHLPQVHNLRPLPQRPRTMAMDEEQGVPWWRRGNVV